MNLAWTSNFRIFGLLRYRVSHLNQIKSVSSETVPSDFTTYELVTISSVLVFWLFRPLKCWLQYLSWFLARQARPCLILWVGYWSSNNVGVVESGVLTGGVPWAPERVYLISGSILIVEQGKSKILSINFSFLFLAVSAALSARSLLCGYLGDVSKSVMFCKHFKLRAVKFVSET